MKNLKIGVRLGGAFAAVLLLLTSLTVVGIVQMQSASKETDALVNVEVRNERLIAEWTKVIEVNAARLMVWQAAWMMKGALESMAPLKRPIACSALLML